MGVIIAKEREFHLLCITQEKEILNLSTLMQIKNNELKEYSVFNYRKSSDTDSGRQIRCTPDWSENAVATDHLWQPTTVSVDFCYIGENECTVSLYSCFCLLFPKFKLLCLDPIGKHLENNLLFFSTKESFFIFVFHPRGCLWYTLPLLNINLNVFLN